ncbi:chemotaxis protein MotC [Rhodopseudomonas julia]|uniref:Chemotaxis protein MotC n=1 Tax=Rhodopseudomonas julia TaxID=200617 RepID=A0ABU0C723_9BRAD|nr:chemotaxis protein MotC [Rhodopseudomonas julia]MDQ0326311.1 chemotaxis protein MotC [Rhodopseudomonas julia]
MPVTARPGLDAASLFRDLQSAQDRIAQGSTEALAEQRQVLDRIEVEFRKAPPETWQDSRNAVSLVGYVLSGGRPAVLRDILRSEQLPAIDEQLMRGALAYAEGRAQAAKEALAEVKARNFTSMGSQVAIAQAALVVAEDPVRAAALLDEARLLAPGTLAEEAALRREILVVAELQQVEKFALLSRQYLQRFRHSVYAGNFRQRFATALTRMKFVDNPEELPRLDDILSDMEPEARQELYLIIARAAVVQAKAPIARFAADRVLAMSDLGETAKEQARLYRAAVSVVGVETFDGASAALKEIDRNLLEEADRDLLDVVLGIADSIRRAPQVTLADVAADRPADETAADATPASAAASPQAAELKDEFSQTNPTIARAQQAVEAADELLGGAQ